MQSHQKYFPTFDNKNEITNEFLIVANKKDQKGLIKLEMKELLKLDLVMQNFFGIKTKLKI